MRQNGVDGVAKGVGTAFRAEETARPELDTEAVRFA